MIMYKNLLRQKLTSVAYMKLTSNDQEIEVLQSTD